MSDFVYLASQSPRRRQLLDQIGVRHELLLPDPHEDAESLEAELPGEAPDAYCERVTRAKLEAALLRRTRRGVPPAPVLCADTTVALGPLILGKPADAEDAQRMLRLLSGTSHLVISAVAVSHLGQEGGGEAIGFALSTSVVHVEPIPEEELQAYVASGEPFGKAGSYAIQSRAAAWISRIEGSYSGIMGLPLHETARLLKRAGVRF